MNQFVSSKLSTEVNTSVNSGTNIDKNYLLKRNPFLFVFCIYFFCNLGKFAF